MTPRQQRFVEEYLVDLNATQAAIRVGYSEKSATVQGARLLADAKVRAAIDAAKVQRAQTTGLNAQRVLQEYLHLAFGDIRELFESVPGGLRLKPVSSWPESAGRAIASVKIRQEVKPGTEPMEVIEFKLWSKTDALAKLGQHLKLFNDVGSKENPAFMVITEEIVDADSQDGKAASSPSGIPPE